MAEQGKVNVVMMLPSSLLLRLLLWICSSVAVLRSALWRPQLHPSQEERI